MKNSINSIGLIPPQALELEEAVIGCCIMERNAIITASKYLTPEMFYKESHQNIYSAIIRLNDERSPIDLLTVVEKMRGLNTLDHVGGAITIAQLSNKVGSSSHLEYHCQIIYDKYCRREMIVLAENIKNDMFNDEIDITESIGQINTRTVQLLTFNDKEEKHIKTAINDAVKESIRLNEKDPTLMGVKTGFSYFDKFSGGIQKGDLVVIGGEPSNGKTTLALNICQNAAMHNGLSVVIFSFEMTVNQIAARMMAYDKRFSSKDMISGAIDRDSLNRISGDCFKLKGSNIRIVKPRGSSFAKLKNDIARVKLEYNCELIVIDYLQLITNNRSGASKAELVGDMANELKAIAIDINTPIILLSQLARDTSNPRPSINRLKYSGDIEAAADTIIMPYLPFKYGKVTEMVNNDTKEVGENGIIIIGKGRNIGTTEFMLEFKKDIPGFYNYFDAELPSIDNYIESHKEFDEVAKTKSLPF